jgi:hypothetical protein
MDEGFGRFGRNHDDGLLTLNVTPTGCETPPTCVPFCIRWVPKGATVTPVGKVKITRLEKTYTVQVREASKKIHRTIRLSILYPGMALRAEPGMRLRFVDRDEKPIPVTIRRLKQAKEKEAMFLVARADQASMTFVLVFPASVRKYITLGKDYIALSGRVPSGGDFIRIVTPWGLWENPAWYGWCDKPYVQKLAVTAGQLPIPTRLSYTEKLAPDGKSVTITETFDTDYAPISPILWFYKDQGSLTFPLIKIEGTPDTRFPSPRTKWGEYAAVRGNTLRYTLAVPPTDARGYINAKITIEKKKKEEEKNEHVALTTLLNDLVGHLGGDWATNGGVDLAYAGMANAALAWGYLTPEKQQAVRATWAKYLALAFTPSAWNITTEPFSGLSYHWTYKIDGPGGYNYDIEWGNALTLYGLYVYANTTGDWDFVRKNWDFVQKIWRYFDLGDDWAWMTVVNADHGYSTGTGDPLCAYYCATIACLNMARALGDTSNITKFSARAARVAIPTVARFPYTDYARLRGFIGNLSVVLGYHEKEGFTRCQLGKDDPWDVMTLFSADGALPELFSLYATAKRGAGILQAYESNYPHWAEGDYKYPFPTTYNGNSVYVVFPYLMARIRLHSFDLEETKKGISVAKTNPNNAWIAPNVLAEFLSDWQIHFTQWYPAAFEGASIHNNIITAKFRLAKITQWTLQMRFDNTIKIKRVTINDKAVPFSQVKGDFESVLVIHVSASGSQNVKIITLVM